MVLAIIVRNVMFQKIVATYLPAIVFLWSFVVRNLLN